MNNNRYNLISGDCSEVLLTIPSNTLDACITDPPYGMGMAKWDNDVPGIDVWQEVYRVLKPGAYCLVFCSPRLYHKLAGNLEKSGLEVVDQIMWMTTTKMPKKNGLKPCHEPIAVAQKPKSESTVEKNFGKWGTGKINIDECRVPWNCDPPKGWVAGGHKRRTFGQTQNKVENLSEKYGTVDANPNGRYPSNIIGSVLPNHQKYFYDPVMEDDENAYDNYYYSGRVTGKERGEYNNHPTPKPVKLMRYLIRLYSPLGGVILDPFSGSGSTGVGALYEQRHYFGIEKEEEYNVIAEQRIQSIKTLDKFSQNTM